MIDVGQHLYEKAVHVVKWRTHDEFGFNDNDDFVEVGWGEVDWVLADTFDELRHNPSLWESINA
jgi:hypothetical protein